MFIQIQSHTSKKSESVVRLMEALGNPNAKVFHYGQGVDKLDQYQFFLEQGIPSPMFTTKLAQAKQWANNGFDVVCRTLTQGQEGHGILITDDPAQLPADAKVFTCYQPSSKEFRVNLFKGKFVNIREKKLMKGFKANKVRSRDNGYTFCIPNSNEPLKPRLIELAQKAAKVTQSDFAGVDIIWNKTKDKLFVLEVNSGPAIEGQSVQDFAKVIKEYAAQS